MTRTRLVSEQCTKETGPVLSVVLKLRSCHLNQMATDQFFVKIVTGRNDKIDHKDSSKICKFEIAKDQIFKEKPRVSGTFRVKVK